MFMPISVDLCEWKNFKAFFHRFLFISFINGNYTSCVGTRFITPKALPPHRWFLLLFFLIWYHCTEYDLIRFDVNIFLLNAFAIDDFYVRFDFDGVCVCVCAGAKNRQKIDIEFLIWMKINGKTISFIWN